MIYSSEDDVHFPSLTVDETLRFAARMRIPRNRPQGVTRKDLEESTVDMLETMFGLRHVKDTFVGDAAIRGVSGGEKKRVTISEALALRMLVGSWDEYVMSIETFADCLPTACYLALREGLTHQQHWSSFKRCDWPQMSSACQQ